MTIDEFVASLSEMLGEPAEWEDDALSFETGDGATVTLEHDPEEELLYLYADVAQVDDRHFGPMAAMLLDASLYGGATGGTAAFGYDREEEKVVLWDKFPLDGLSFDTFRERLGVFVSAVAHWSANIVDESGSFGDAPAANPTHIISPGMMA